MNKWVMYALVFFLGADAGFFLSYAITPQTAPDLIKNCNIAWGEGEWKVVKNENNRYQCVNITVMQYIEDINLTTWLTNQQTGKQS